MKHREMRDYAVVTVTPNDITQFSVKTDRNAYGEVFHQVTLTIVGSGVNIQDDHGNVMTSSGLGPHFVATSLVPSSTYDAKDEEVITT